MQIILSLMLVFLTIKTLRWDKGEEMLMRFPNAYWLIGSERPTLASYAMVCAFGESGPLLLL